MFTIVGKGFGLYGYLPAIINVFNAKVVLPEQYKANIESRPELFQFAEQISWCSTISEALNQATGIVIAVTPESQKDIIQKVISFQNIKYFFLEKPICPDPVNSILLVNTLIEKDKSFRVGYSFLNTNWYHELKKNLQQHVNHLQITWTFKADHFVRGHETWKRYHSKGGGVLRFYGIHLIAVLASLGYNETSKGTLNGSLKDQPDTWDCIFYGPNLPKCSVHISTNDTHSNFHVESYVNTFTKNSIYHNLSPFLMEKSLQNQDIRVSVLEKLIRSVHNNDDDYFALYRSINYLWQQSELNLSI